MGTCRQQRAWNTTCTTGTSTTRKTNGNCVNLCGLLNSLDHGDLPLRTTTEDVDHLRCTATAEISAVICSVDRPKGTQVD